MRLIRSLVGLGVAGVATAVATDRLLGLAASGSEPRPVRAFTVVDAPPMRVWAELTDIEAQPRWMREMKRVRLLTPGPVGVGTRGEALVRVLGIPVVDPVTVTEFEAPVRFAIRHEGTFTGRGVIDLEPGADGTTTVVRWAETLVPPLLPRLASLVQRPVLGRIFQADLGRFRDLLEASGTVRAPEVDGGAGRPEPAPGTTTVA